MWPDASISILRRSTRSGDLQYSDGAAANVGFASLAAKQARTGVDDGGISPRSPIDKNDRAYRVAPASCRPSPTQCCFLTFHRPSCALGFSKLQIRARYETIPVCPYLK